MYYRDKLRGEVMLKLRCNPDRRDELDRIWFQDLNAGEPHGIIENDAVDENEDPMFLDICWTSPVSTVSAMRSRYSTRNVVRYLRINNLICPFKNLIDDNKIAFLAAVDVFYLSEEEQETVYKVIDKRYDKNYSPTTAGAGKDRGNTGF